MSVENRGKCPQCGEKWFKIIGDKLFCRQNHLVGEGKHEKQGEVNPNGPKDSNTH